VNPGNTIIVPTRGIFAGLGDDTGTYKKLYVTTFQCSAEFSKKKINDGTMINDQ
jgi:hypothetical protein